MGGGLGRRQHGVGAPLGRIPETQCGVRLALKTLCSAPTAALLVLTRKIRITA